ncbi:3'-5' exonuclease [bacterium]|nr:3'-5' exonuclease [bacterium]
MENYYLSIDLEMTGLDPSWDEIIQIGCVLYDHEWNQLGLFLQNVYPLHEERFSDSAAKVHGLSLVDLYGSPLISDGLKNMESWISELLQKKEPTQKKNDLMKKVIICGQSVGGDLSFLKAAYRENHLYWPFSYRALDLYSLSLFVFQVLEWNGFETPKSLSLDSIANYYGYKRSESTHNALEDAKLTGKSLRDIMYVASRLKYIEDEEE